MVRKHVNVGGGWRGGDDILSCIKTSFCSVVCVSVCNEKLQKSHHVQLNRHCNCSKGNIGETSERQDGTWHSWTCQSVQSWIVSTPGLLEVLIPKMLDIFTITETPQYSHISSPCSECVPSFPWVVGCPLYVSLTSENVKSHIILCCMVLYWHRNTSVLV